MSKYWKLKIFIFLPLILMLLSISHKAYGYIDPGTTSAIFGILAPLLSILLIILGFLIQPFRRFFRFVIDKFRESAKAKTNEQLRSEGQRKQTESGNSRRILSH